MRSPAKSLAFAVALIKRGPPLIPVLHVDNADHAEPLLTALVEGMLFAEGIEAKLGGGHRARTIMFMELAHFTRKRRPLCTSSTRFYTPR